MSPRKAAPNAETVKRYLDSFDPTRQPGRLRKLGGSRSDDWNVRVAKDTIEALWLKNSDVDGRQQQVSAAVAALIGIAPKDEIEGMIAAQLIAAHSAAMECYRRAMIGEQTFEGRRESLSQANKLSRSFAVLLDTLNRHRGKGQQTVRVEHVHVHSGGQAVVGAVTTTGEGIARNLRNKPMQGKLPMHRSRRCHTRTRSGRPCRSPAMANGRCRTHGGLSPGAPRGNRNALKHGRYAAEAIAWRHEIAGLLSTVKLLVKTAE